MHRRSFVLGSAAAAACTGIASAADPLVISSPGSLPLMLTVPHDGDAPIGNAPVRSAGTTLRDLGTRPLAEKVAALLEGRLGARPRMVIARFSRKFLDANRPEHEAMESPEALPAYQSYHVEIAQHVAALREAFPKGALLLDIHGQSQAPDTAFRGTRAGLTVTALLKRRGVDAIQGDRSILGALAAQGYGVHPAPGSPALDEDRRFAGGHTLFLYGSHRATGIDAIQLEFGRNQRASEQLAPHLADAIAVFLGHHGYLDKS